MKTDWQDALQTFLNNNPDIPAGGIMQDEKPQSGRQVQGRLDIVLDRKGRAGKSATIISGFTMSDEEISALASKIRRKLGTGGSDRGGEILIQGDRRSDVLEFLIANGFKARII